MSAETLRRAASLMRERAEAATPGPWRVENLGSHGNDSWALDIARWRNYTNTVNFGDDKATAEHIAALPPAVALAVADWLDDLANRIVLSRSLRHEDEERRALAVARAYLGGDS